MTLLELVEQMSARLDQAGVSFGHGTRNAFDEAAWLTQWRLGLPLDGLDDAAGQPVDAATVQAVQALVEQRIATRQPAAYLTREAWLQGVPFYVDERAIVPRSFIAELLADGSLEPWLDGAAPPDSPPRILDLCTGNGSLAVLAALAWPDAVVHASDISADALEVARINLGRHGLHERVTLFVRDGLQGLSGPYDLILCNPPYVNAAAMAALPAEYRAEPSLALDGNRAGGADGMDFIRALLRDAARCLTPRGALVLEIGHERAGFERAFPRSPAIWLDTSAGADQVLLLTRDALPPAAP